MMRRLALVLTAWLLFAELAAAAPLGRNEVPEPLRPWIDWALRGREEALCPFLDSAGERRCVWPSRLDLDLDERGGRFTQDWRVFREAWVPLPGDVERWPLNVRVDGKPAAVALRDGTPAVRLEKGKHTVAGIFEWDQVPEILTVPPETGLVALTLRGQTVGLPTRDPLGQLWLQRAAGGEAEEVRLDVSVHRRLVDEVPLELTTRIELRVSGRNREVLLGRALPEGFVPMALDSPLPARLEPDGRMRVQVRPGVWTMTLTARHVGPAGELALAEGEGPWDGEEVWAFEARSALRLVTVEGVQAIDPQQTELPPEWRQLPAYPMKPGSRMRLVERRRGDADPPPHRLALARTLWLDFDGGGYTMKDQITGALERNARLEMPPPGALGRVAIGGIDQLITRAGGSAAAGVELRPGPLSLEADSRFDADAGRLSAVGWNQDFQQVGADLNLPPGWRLFHASGVDQVSTSWLGDWTLLDFFLVLVITLAAARVWGFADGALALVTLVLIYRESGAPTTVWIVILAAEALVRALPEGRFLSAMRSTRLVAVVLLVLTAIPFAIDQARYGLYPQLERPWQAVPQPAAVGGGRVTGKIAQTAPVPAEERGAEVVESEAYDRLSRAIVPPRYRREAAKVAPSAPPERQLLMDPNAVITTGPGLPRWTWNVVALRWQGPVERSQALGLWLLSPRLNLWLACLRIAFLALLVLRALRSLDLARFAPPGTPGTAASVVAAGLFVLTLGVAAPSAAADFPPQEILDQLRDRMLENAECFPSCASSPRLQLVASSLALTLRLEVDAATDTAVPLPGGARGWSPSRVAVDGQPAEALAHHGDGTLWLALAAGKHQVLLEGPLPDVDTLALALPLKPHRVDATATGWTVEGIREDGSAEDNLRLIRVREAGTKGEALQPGALPPFLRVERRIRLGLTWEVDTAATRLTPLGTALNVEVPLLAGESVTTPEVRVSGDKALAAFGPSVSEVRWHSVLREAPTLALAAPPEVPWTEVWVLDASPIWHVEAKGIPPIHEPMGPRQWRPWPGERLELAITRPPGIGGRTLTVDSSTLRVRPGRRATDATLALEIRASRGAQHAVTLPEGAELQAVTIRGATQPIRQEARTVTLPILPGTQSIALDWREPRSIEWELRAPEIGIGLPSVNAETAIEMPADRWTLFAGGGRLGPAVLFWSFLVVLALVATALGRSRLAPLGTLSWFLLGLGLTQSPLFTAAVVAGWLLVLGWRERHGRSLSGGNFNALQVVLALWTVAALLGLFSAIKRGLLGLPEMQIGGNGSTSGLLRWYHDRSGEILPRPWVLSVPMAFYRAAMLAWALWIAWALLGWLRWGWTAFGEGGLWRPREPGARRFRRSATSPPATP